MSGYARNSRLAAYQSVSAHGSVASADPHRLVLMLMDAALERLAMARGCIERGEIAKKAQLLTSCVSIIAELHGSLDLKRGASLAKNLSELYDYMVRQLVRANVENNLSCIKEVASLLGEIRGSWVAIGPEVGQVTQAAVNA